MLNSGKNFALVLILVLSKKKFLNETKNHNPPPLLHVKWPVPKMFEYMLQALESVTY